MNLAQTSAALGAYIDADIPAFLWGAPGIGKSDCVAALAKARNLPMIDLRAILLDPVDLRGLPYVSDGLASWARPTFLPDADRHGPEGILFLDELNAAPPSTQAACFQLVLNRRVGEYSLPPGWRIVAAGNRQTDRAAAQRMPSALANRFAHIDVEASPEDWRAWANRAGISPMVSAFIAFRPELLHKMDSPDLRAFPTPRAWSQVSKVADASPDLRAGLVAGLVGEGAGAEFEGFARLYSELPSIRMILADPNGARVPDKPAARYAVATGIARAATADNFDAVMTYAQRLPREFEILACLDAVKRDGALTGTPAFLDFAARNQDVML